MRLGVARRKHRPNELPMDEETPLKEREASPNLDDDDASQSEDEAGPELSACGMIETWLRESLVMPLMSMYFVMLMINTLLRDTKDTLLVNSVAGVAAIPILKSWVTIPSSMLFFVLYSKLSHSSLSSRGQFLAVLICFSFFYILFAAVIYPFKHHISPSAWGQALREQNPKGSASATFASVAEEWTLGLFYVVSELWSSAVCQLLFWQVANDVMTIGTAKDAYPVIGAMGNAGLVVAGRLLLVFADRRDVDSAVAYLRVTEKQRHNESSAFPHPVSEFDAQIESAIQRVRDDMDPSENAWLGTLIGIAILVTSGAAFIAVCYDDVYRRLHMYHPHLATRRRTEDDKHKEQVNIDLWSALKTLAISEPLRLVAVLVASYGVSSSLIEVSWKGQVKRAFPSTGAYSRFMGSFWTWTGLSSMACMLLSRAMLHNLGYRVAVVFTPLAMMIAGGVFFSVALAVAIYGMRSDSLVVAAYAGAFAVLVAKSAKYAVFDATKEMVFIPLDRESRVVGKAAIDVVAYRLAKSGGSVVLQAVLVVFGSLDDTGLFPIGLVFSLVVVVWLRAALATGRLVHEAQRVENLDLHGAVHRVVI